MVAVATYREIITNGVKTAAYDVDINGRTIKHGDIVRISGAYFKNDNGLWLVKHAPGDENWCGKDYSLYKLNKNGTLSQSKYNVAFWPIIVVVNDHMKKLEARAHNAEHAQIEIITPAATAAEPTKDEPKEEPAAEETAPVQHAERAQESAKTPRYQVIVNDDRYGGLDEKMDYSRIADARKAMRDYVNKEDWESAAIYDRKSGEIVEAYGEYFPADQINVRAKAAVMAEVSEPQEEPAESAQTKDDTYAALIEDIRNDFFAAGITCTGVTVTDGAPATIHFEIVCGESDDTFFRACSVIEHHQTSDDFAFYAYPVNFWYDVRPCQPEPMPKAAGIDFEACAEVVPTTSAEENHAESAGFFPVVANIPRKSQWDVWNVHPDEYLTERVVPLVRCDKYCHVLETIYLKVDTAEEVKILMSAAAVGDRRRWPKYSKPYRRETVRRAADIIEKYYVENAINAARRITT